MLLFFFIKVVILMMKLKHFICCGLDVHKNVIVATIVTTNKDGISEYKQKSFSTINLTWFWQDGNPNHVLSVGT